MASITVTLSGNSSSLNGYFHPEIELDEKYNYSCCLLDFYSYNSIPNVTGTNNKFYLMIDDKLTALVIPIGIYEIDEIIDYLKNECKNKGVNLAMEADKITMKCTVRCSVMIDFTRNDCIGQVFGFSNRKLPAGLPHKSNKVVNIQNINNLRIDCDLTTGSFHNGKSTHTIYEFYPSVDPGYKINEQPKHLIYLPIIQRRISTINISIVDPDGELVDFQGEKITCRLHIKRDT